MRLGEHLRQRYRAILKNTGLIWIIIGLLVLAPLLALPFYWQERVLAWGFLLPGLTLILLGFVLWRGLKPPEGLSLTVIEGTVIIVLVWLGATTVGAIPFILVGDLNFSLAFFESTSGWTTTGLSVVDVAAASPLILLHRSIMQVTGGAGFAIIVHATLTGPAGVGLASAEGREEQLAPHVRQSASIVLRIYVGYIIFGILGLRLVGMNWFDAVNHAFAALAGGGFSTRPESIGYWDSSLVEAFIIVLMLLSTINFLTSYTFLQGDVRRATRSSELRFMGFLFLIFIPIVFFGVTLGLYPQLGKAVRVAVFEIVSATTTTGFSTVAYNNWSSIGWLVLLLLMLIGGGTGSTAGGIKQHRVVVLLRGLLWDVRRWFMPRAVVTSPDIWQAGEHRFLSDTTIRKESTFITLYLIVFLIGSGIIAAHGYPLAESLFEFASSAGNVGLSIGITGATTPLSVIWTQTAGMILGRLEFFAVIVGLVKLLGDLPQMLRRRETEAEVVFREGQLTPGQYLVLVPVAAQADAATLGQLGCMMAKGADGQVLALTVIKVPPILNPLAGRVLLRDRQPLVDTVVEQAQRYGVPVQAMVRSTRNVPAGISRTIRRSGSDLVLFGWPRPDAQDGHAFSTVIDPIIADPPCDIAVLRSRPFDQLRTLLVPVSGRANERLAIDIATRLARSSGPGAMIRLVYVASPDLPESEIEERANHIFDHIGVNIHVPFEMRVVQAASAANGILRAAEDCDMIVIGATKEPLLRNLLLGNVAQTVADEASCPVMIVKRRSTLFRSVLRDTLLKPVPRSSKLGPQGPPRPPNYNPGTGQQ